MKFFCILFIIFSVLCCGDSKCRKIKSRMCKAILKSKFSLPNLFGHRTRSEANLEINQYHPLVKIGCSPYLRPFLCSVYFAPCNHRGPKLPCRSLCEGAKTGCTSVMAKFGFQWPRSLECSRFPVQNSTSHCIQPETFGLLQIKDTS